MISFRFVSQFTYSVSFRFSVYRFCLASSYFVVFRFSLYRDPRAGGLARRLGLNSLKEAVFDQFDT